MRRPFRRTMQEDPRECAEVRELFTDYLDEDLDARAKGRVEEHVGVCPRCWQALANLQHTVAGLRRLREGRAPAETVAVVDRVREAWRNETRS